MSKSAGELFQEAICSEANDVPRGPKTLPWSELDTEERNRRERAACVFMIARMERNIDQCIEHIEEHKDA